MFMDGLVSIWKMYILLQEWWSTTDATVASIFFRNTISSHKFSIFENLKNNVI